MTWGRRVTLEAVRTSSAPVYACATVAVARIKGRISGILEGLRAASDLLGRLLTVTGRAGPENAVVICGAKEGMTGPLVLAFADCLLGEGRTGGRSGLVGPKIMAPALARVGRATSRKSAKGRPRGPGHNPNCNHVLIFA